MGTGIVSVALSLDRYETLSRILLVLAAAAWVGLGVLVAGRVLRGGERARRALRSPLALTVVAGTAVLGSRLTMLGSSAIGGVLLALAAISWLALLAPVLTHWVTPTTGSSLLLVVSTESLAALSAALAARSDAPWLLDLALVPFVLGLGFYVFVIRRFELRELLTGRGDHWITGGVLAISTLAGAELAIAAAELGTLGSIRKPLDDASQLLWALAVAWLPALLLAEALRPRLGYDVRRWSMVFPVGMYAACSFLVGDAVHSAAIGDFARVWTWIAVAVWLAVFAGMIRRFVQLARSDIQRVGT
jgi:tellurite resistance protein TehA-like permease